MEPLSSSPSDSRFSARQPSGLGGRFYGVYPALVSDIRDPDNQGRVKVRLPWSPDAGEAAYEAWARLATMMAGNNRGTWFIPDPDDEVLVVFEAGDPSRPYVIGSLWNASNAPPDSMDASGENNCKVICSRNGVRITLDDQSGQEQMMLETPGGQKITLKDGPGSVEVADSHGNSITLDASGITVNASANVKINAGVVELSAGMLNVNAGMSKFSGVVQADSVITNSVVSASYTNGAGNIW